jgi:hypothetical protein
VTLQSGPEKGGGHSQAKVPSPAAGAAPASLHAPPFRHGLSSYRAHSRSSSHDSPPKPRGQAQEKDRSPSAQAAPFWQGLELHSLRRQSGVHCAWDALEFWSPAHAAVCQCSGFPLPFSLRLALKGKSCQSRNKERAAHKQLPAVAQPGWAAHQHRTPRPSLGQRCGHHRTALSRSDGMDCRGPRSYHPILHRWKVSVKDWRREVADKVQETQIESNGTKSET